MRYGIYDTKDNCWMGDTKGPKIFDSVQFDGVKLPEAKDAADIAAQMACAQLGWPITRLRARIFDEGPLRHKDDLKTKMGSLKALERIETGYL